MPKKVAACRGYCAQKTGGTAPAIIEITGGTYTVSGGAIEITRAVTVRAAAGATVVLDGAGSSKVMKVNAAGGATVTLERLTLKGGAGLACVNLEGAQGARRRTGACVCSG